MQNQVSLYLAGKKYLEAIDAEDIDEILPPPQPPPTPARIDDQHLENAYFLMPPDHRALFDVFPNQDHLRHIEAIDKFIDSFLDQAQAMEIPTTGGPAGKGVTTPNAVQGTDNSNLIGDPDVKRLVMQMSSEQKQELLANLLRHRSLHLAFFYGQMNGAMDENGQPTQPPGAAGPAGNGQGNPNGQGQQPMAGQGPAGGMAQTPSNDPHMAAIINALQATPGNQVV